MVHVHRPLPALLSALPCMLAVAAVTAGCNKIDGGDDSLGGGPEKDARLVTDVYTWDCIEYTDAGEELYQGVFGEVVRLQFAPDALPIVPLPSVGGCTAQLNMFPEDAGAGGLDIPGAATDDISWETDGDGGVFQYESAGFWRDDVFEDNRTCNNINDVLLGGTRLVDAGVLDGVGTPTPEDVPVVGFSGLSMDPGTGAETIQFGDEITASWAEHDWDTVWVQVRRELEGVAWESVTCNATGLDSFTLDSAVWSQLDENISVDQNQLYIGFEKSELVETADGYKVETSIRSMAVAIVRD